MLLLSEDSWKISVPRSRSVQAFVREGPVGCETHDAHVAFACQPQTVGVPVTGRALLPEALQLVREEHRIELGRLAGKREAMFREACRMGLEGIVSKRVDSRYVTVGR